MALRALILANLVFGGLVLALFIASLIAEDWVWTALGVRPSGSNATLFLWGRVVMVIGIGSVPFTYIVLTRLLAIVDTVRLGDPFVAGNAARCALRNARCDLRSAAVSARGPTRTCRPSGGGWSVRTRGPSACAQAATDRGGRRRGITTAGGPPRARGISS